MRIVTCIVNHQEKLGLLHDEYIYICDDLSADLPHSMQELLDGGSTAMHTLERFFSLFIQQKNIAQQGIPATQVELVAPVTQPTSFRDAYAFRQHVETSRRNRGLDMIPEFDNFPVFYFSNHRVLQGPGKVYAMPLHFDKLDFELEIAIVLNKKGKNIPASEADQYIAGYMIMNDISARALQMEEMKLNLGPAKGKDFATSIGPFLVTPDELEPHKVPAKKGHIGNAYNLEMTCSVNNVLVSKGNFADMHWTFAEIIERVSYGVELYPGDIIGSGTVGTGCFLELNGTGKLKDMHYKEQWLQPGDEVKMNVTALGELSNTMLLLHS